MYTDIVGYTALTGQDESLALHLLEEHRKLLRPLFTSHNGREVKTVGDMFLVEFPSGLEAVRCAIRIQAMLSKRNESLPRDRRVSVRVGVHVGDVEHRQGDLYGDAVDVGARMEPLAERNGILISKPVFERVLSRPAVNTELMRRR